MPQGQQRSFFRRGEVSPEFLLPSGKVQVININVSLLAGTLKENTLRTVVPLQWVVVLLQSSNFAWLAPIERLRPVVVLSVGDHTVIPVGRNIHGNLIERHGVLTLTCDPAKGTSCQILDRCSRAMPSTRCDHQQMLAVRHPGSTQVCLTRRSIHRFRFSYPRGNNTDVFNVGRIRAAAHLPSKERPSAPPCPIRTGEESSVRCMYRL